MNTKKNSLLVKVIFFNDIIIGCLALVIASILTFIIFGNLDRETNRETENLIKMVMSSYHYFGKILEDDSMKIGNIIETERVIKDKKASTRKPYINGKNKGEYYYIYKDLKEGDNSIYYHRYARELKRQLYEPDSIEDQTRIISIVDGDGKILAENSGNILNNDYSISKSQPFIDKLLRKNNIFNNSRLKMYSMEYIEPENKMVLRAGSVIGYSRSILENPGAMFVTLIIDKHFIEELKNSLKFKRGVRTFILDRNGNYYLGDFSDKEKKDLKEPELLEGFNNKNLDYIVIKKSIAKEIYYVGYFPVYDVNGDVSGIIGITQSTKEINMVKMKTFVLIMIGSLIIVLISSVIFGIMLYRFVKPLMIMTDLVQGITNNEIEKKELEIKGFGEIEILSDSFTKMIGRITDANKELEVKNEMMKESINKLKIIEKLIFSIYSEEDKDKVCYYALSAITSEVGLGYGRAIFFEYNSEKERLEGKLATSNINLIDRKENSGDFETFLHDMRNSSEIQTEALDQIVKLIKIANDGKSIISFAFQENKTMALLNIKHEEQGDMLLANLNLRNLVILPVVYKNKRFGCIIVDNCLEENRMGDSDIEILNVVVMNIAIYLQNKLLENEKLKSEKLSTMGKVASSIVHEIRNPLASIKGFSDMLLQKYRDDAKIQKYIGIINSEVERLNNLASMLLDYSSNKNYTLEKVKINDIISDVVQFFERDLELKEITVSTLIHEEACILGDKNKIKQALVNLIKNAIEAKDKKFSKINISMKTFKGYCELKIWDNGKGIENEEISKLFEPFNSGKIGGTGLGLSIVREIISNHKGEITFESEAGKWTEITIKFNLYKEE